VAPPSTPNSRPGRYLTALLVLLVVMLAGVLGANIIKPTDWHKSFVVGRGLDLSSGTSVTLQAVTPKKGEQPSQAAMTKAIQIITNRVDATGLSGASVVQQGKDQIVVSVPGAGAQKVASLVGETALLRMRQVLLVAPNFTTATATPTPSPTTSTTPKAGANSSSPSASPTASAGSGQAVGASQIGASASPSPTASSTPTSSPSASSTPSTSPTASTTGKPVLSTTADGSGNASLLTPATVKLFNKVNCDDKNWKSQIYRSAAAYDNPDVQTIACLGGSKYAMDKAVVQGKDLSGVQAQDQATGWVVVFDVKSPASHNLGTLTATMTNQYYPQATSNPNDQVLDLLAVVLDGELQGSPPQVTGPISSAGQINGGSTGFSQNQAESLANVLKYGSLPLSFRNLNTSSVSASLGSDQLSAGLFAALVGLLLVVIYSFLYYRGLGVVSVSSLVIAAVLTYLSVVLLSKYEGFTLTLAGIAGLIVAIGITADSFIVYFERLRDEVREGRSLRTAVERGWTRARRTILVSDTVSFLAALLLYILSIGDVRGFAFTLGLTTLIDVIVVFLFTKPMVTLLARTKFYGQGHKMSGLDPARLGARAPWRGGRRPATTGTGTGTGTGTVATAPRSSTSTREA
jgi:preprotein translocase subunit SecD